MDKTGLTPRLKLYNLFLLRSLKSVSY